ncbi:MAG: glycosyltransferase [Alphaproteobacteria bacterium]|nr:glycosyltransferase [Alphaproteobacteria bacterium]
MTPTPPVPAVSVLMPVFNGERFLREAIDSVLAQSFDDFELVVVDDGSLDGTAAIAQGYAARDGRVRYLRKANSGIGETLNRGLEVARAPLVARLDADDVMEPARLARQVHFLAARPELGGAASNFAVIDAAGRIRQRVAPLPGGVAEIEPFLARGGRLRYTHPTVIYRRDPVMAVGGYRRELEPAEDVDLFLRLYEAGHPMIVQPECLTRYRVHSGQISATRLFDAFHKVEFIHENFFRRRFGVEEIDYDRFLQLLRELPLRARLEIRTDFAAERLHRRSTSLLIDGRTVSAYACLAGAACLRPVRAFKRVLRQGRLM